MPAAASQPSSVDPLEAELRRAAEFRAALRAFLVRTEEVTSAAGLTPQRYDLLLTVRASAGRTSTVTEIAKRLSLRQTAVTELVKRAEEAGLIVRVPASHDGRVTLLRLTREGDRRLVRAFAALRDDRANLNRAFRHLGARLRAVTRADAGS